MVPSTFRLLPDPLRQVYLLVASWKIPLNPKHLESTLAQLAFPRFPAKSLSFGGKTPLNPTNTYKLTGMAREPTKKTRTPRAEGPCRLLPHAVAVAMQPVAIVDGPGLELVPHANAAHAETFVGPHTKRLAREGCKLPSKNGEAGAFRMP